MSTAPGVINHIDWRGIFPWLILFRTFRIAISPTLMILAAAAVLISPLGWMLGERVFLNSDERVALRADHVIPPRAENSQLGDSLPLAPRAYLPVAVHTALLEAYFDLAEPLTRF